MSEISLIDVRAQVMTYDEGIKKWTPSGSGEPSISKVQLFVHQQNNTHRIVARKIADKEVVINCALFKGMRYNRATDTFHQWRDTRQVYGLNFANLNDAISFGDTVQEALDGSNKRLSQNSISSSVNGDTHQQDRQQLEKERQKLLDEQREQDRLTRMREADEEADRRRIAEEKIRKEKEEKARLEQERRDQEELQRKLNLQRKKEDEDEKLRLAEQERRLEEAVAEKQRELDDMRAMEKKVQDDMESKFKSSPPPKGFVKKETHEDIEPVTSVGNTFGVQLKYQNPIKSELPIYPPPPPLSKQSASQYEEQIQDNLEIIEPPRSPSPAYNIPSPPPDMPASFHKGGAGGHKQKVVTQSSATISQTKSRTGSQKGGQNNNLMDEIQKRFESMKNRSGATKEDVNRTPTPTSPYPTSNRNISPNPAPAKANQSFTSNEKKEVTKQDSLFKNKQTPTKTEVTITAKDLQTMKSEIMRDIKIELERTKQDILTEIRKELSKR
ncbi:putative homer protein-like 2 isoform X2 [Oopsacas minuta]|uniref:Homer protein-like 2 isoform X2 n=1 Tax=Oopsacas minuta TaxID=111878 RepID=A0AAV7KDD5_9METZ|nr:putative homer protein-like 2 isoform X2 [Oopsacas minuta]